MIHQAGIMALLALTAALLTGQAAPAFADDNYGPGMFIDNPQPETNTDTAADPATDSQAADPTQTADPVPGQETAPADGSHSAGGHGDSSHGDHSRPDGSHADRSRPGRNLGGDPAQHPDHTHQGDHGIHSLPSVPVSPP